MSLKISARVREKLKHKHCVAEEEIIQCFASRCGRYLTDTRARHATNPPILWFIAETDRGRLLKVVFVQTDGEVEIKTAYPPNETEIRIYEKYAGRIR